MVQIVQATSEEEIAGVRELFREYADSVEVDLCFKGFHEELAGLPGDYTPPEGSLLIAKEGERLVGCVAMHKLVDGTGSQPADCIVQRLVDRVERQPGEDISPQVNESVCEIKRLYLRPGFRGQSTGRNLALAIIAQARAMGYQRMSLDTLPSMQAAIALYRSLGFREIAPYGQNPIAGALYMELTLQDKPTLACEWRRGDLLISTDNGLIDLAVVHGFLATSYWAAGIPLEVVERSIEHSLAFGVYVGKQQAGFARVITDYATYAYLADVFVLEAFRGQGLGTWLVECIVAHPALQGLRRWTLFTRDAHGLYEKVGFERAAETERLMVRKFADVYSRLHL